MLNHKIITDFIPTTKSIEDLFDKLWPICRSITGNGFRESIEILQKIIPLDIESVPSGTEVFDWVVPKEWNIKDAYVLDPNGKKIINFKDNNLHVLNYSKPVDKEISLSDLKKHLYTIPEIPDAIPYVTSYYKERWGFCISQNHFNKLKDGLYKVKVESTLTDGELNYGHTILPSTTGSKKEFLISTYLCHPSMANNELSGPIVATFLYDYLSKLKHREYNYRFVFIPETIGSICYLSKYGQKLINDCIGGLVVTCCGDEKALNYKKSREENSLINKVCENIIKHSGYENAIIHDFFPTGSDERQYCSPGFNLPVGSITKSMYGKYKEYHTSLDNKQFVSMNGLVESVNIYLKAILSFEANKKYVNTNPHCEPMLGKRDLYNSIGASTSMENTIHSYLYLLNFSDGKHDLVDIANKMNVSVYGLLEKVEKLKSVGLLK